MRVTTLKPHISRADALESIRKVKDMAKEAREEFPS